MDRFECKGGLFINMMLRTQCNYNCYYCLGARKDVETRLFDLEKISNIYNNIEEFTLTEFENGRGEPSRHPEIKQLLEIVTQTGGARISSNNSTDPDDWIPKRVAHRINCNLSLHPQGEREFDTFISYMDKLIDFGCTVYVSYVAHPQRLNEIDRLRDFFAKRNIFFDVQIFQGKYKDKEYPTHYTKEELEVVHSKNEGLNWIKEVFEAMPIRDFRDIPCLAGHKMFYIRPDGLLQRCPYDTTTMSDILPNPAPCKVDRCGCGYYLSDFHSLYKIRWNSWRKAFGFPLVPIPDEEQFDESSEEFVKERKFKFINLLRKYKKIKFCDGAVNVVSA